MVLTDDHSRIVGLRVNLLGIKTLFLDLYAPNADKETFYKQSMDRLIDFF